MHDPSSTDLSSTNVQSAIVELANKLTPSLVTYYVRRVGSTNTIGLFDVDNQMLGSVTANAQSSYATTYVTIRGLVTGGGSGVRIFPNFECNINGVTKAAASTTEYQLGSFADNLYATVIFTL